MSTLGSFSLWTSTSIETLSSELVSAIDVLGIESGVAQTLNGPITSVSKLAGTDQQLLLFSNFEGVPVGYIKFGSKDLYFYLKNGKIVQKSGAMCVLDFYVQSAQQRHGIGLLLFQEMLKSLGCSPVQLAYDRPSPKLISFLSKHFGLMNPDIQPNRYAIYQGYLNS